MYVEVISMETFRKEKRKAIEGNMHEEVITTVSNCKSKRCKISKEDPRRRGERIGGENLKIQP